MLLYVSLVLAGAFGPVVFGSTFSTSIRPTRISTSAASTSATSTPAPTHTVQVGAQGFVFTPNQLTAKVGDVVEFLFYPQNHSVARSEYKSPCIPYEDTGLNRTGFWSGFHPTNLSSPDPPSFQVIVNDTEPIFFYCSTPGACINDGMIGVINPNSTETFDTQLEFTKNSTLMFSPGQFFPSEIVPTTSPLSSPSPTSITTSTASASNSSSRPLSTGAIAGIAIGGAAVLVLACALLCLCGRKCMVGEPIRQDETPTIRYCPSHLSTSSAPSISPKIPQLDIDSIHRFSTLGGFYDGSAETVSYRSRCSPFEEGMERDYRIPSIHPGGSVGTPSSPFDEGMERDFRVLSIYPGKSVGSPSSPFDEGMERDFRVPSINLGASAEAVSPKMTQSPITRRAVPESPLRPSPISPISITLYHALRVETPKSSRLNDYESCSQDGPHELPADNEPIHATRTDSSEAKSES